MTKSAMITVLGLAGLSLAAGSALAAPADPTGNWARGDGIARVKVTRCGADLCATNTWIKPGTKSEKKGDILVMKVKPDAAGSYKGTAFDKQRNMNYRMTLNVKGDAMTTRGCVLGGLVCKSVSWARIN